MPRHEGVRDDRYKLISFYDYHVWEFYDLKNDPHELSNLAGNSDYEKEISRMKERLLTLRDCGFNR